MSAARPHRLEAPPAPPKPINPAQLDHFEVMDMILDMSTERRGIVGDVKRNIVQIIWRRTYARTRQKGSVPPLHTQPMSMKDWAELLHTTEKNASEAHRELEKDGVTEAVTGKEARAKGIERRDGVHGLTKHYRLKVENWPNVKAAEPEPPVPIDRGRKPKVNRSADGRIWLRAGQTSTPAPIGATVEEYAIKLRGGGDDLAIEIDPPKVDGKIVCLTIAVANKTGSESHTLLQQDIEKSGHILLQQGIAKLRDMADELILAFRNSEDTRLQRNLTEEQAQTLARKLELRWEHFHEFAERATLKARGSKTKLTFPLLLLVAGDAVGALSTVKAAEQRTRRGRSDEAHGPAAPPTGVERGEALDREQARRRDAALLDKLGWRG